MNRIIKLTLLLLALLLPATAAAHDFEVDGIYYKKSGNNATVTYKGSYDSEYSNEYFGDVIIPSTVTYNGTTYTVTSIGNSAFYHCSELTSITISKSVTSIGNNAFYGCSGFANMMVDNANLKFDSRDNCNAIIETASNKLILGCKTTIIPNTVTTIGDGAFSMCSGLTSITIPSSITEIGNYAFSGCDSLNDVHSDKTDPSLISMGNNVFYLSSANYSNRALYVPEGAVIAYQTDTNWSPYFGTIVEEGTTPIFAQTFEVGMFQYSFTSDSTVTVTKFLSNSYYYNSIEIPNFVTYQNVNYTVTAIGDWAFYNKNIYSVILPETITSIGYAAFKECGDLKSLTMNAFTVPFMNNSFDQHEKPVTFIINTYEFYDYLILNVYKDAYTNYKDLNDQYHFFSLISCIDGDVTARPYFEVVDEDDTFPYSEEPSSISIKILGDEDSYIFVSYGNYGGLSGNVFSCTCDNYCMSTQYYLSAWALTEGKSTSEEEECCGALYPRWHESFDFMDSNLYYNVYDYDNTAEVTHCTYYNPCTYWYGDEDDDYDAIHEYYSGDVVIPNTATYNNETYNVVAIGESAFKKCVNLKSVTIPNSVTNIGSSAFMGCSGLTSITIPNSIRYIQCNAFRRCTKLTEVNITDLAAWCKIDFDVEMDEAGELEYGHSSNPLNYAHHLYLNGTEVTELVIPNTVTEIGWSTFSGCTGISSVFIPNSVIKVGFLSFLGCSNITNLTFGKSVSEIEGETFSGCNGLTIIKCYGKNPAAVNLFGEKKYSKYLLEESSGNEKIDYNEWDECFEECVYQNATLYVPMEAVEAYREADGWRHFQHIVGFYAYDYEADGVYYTITGDGEVMVVHGDDAYQGVVNIPQTVTYEGVTYNVTGICSGAFADATLESLILPVTIGTVEEGAFTGCHIHSLVITGDGTWTAGAISCDVDNLYVMGTVTGIQGLQVNPITVYSYPTVPPTCDEQSFTGYDGELHVPASALAAYFTAPYWCNFINIVGDAIEPTGLTVNRDSVEVLVGNQLRLTATAVPANATPNEIYWTSSDESIATVTDGIITAVKVGECDIKAYLLDKSATCHVTVTEIAPTEVILDQEFAKLEIGSQLTLTATVMPEDATDKFVTWTTTNSDVATVDSLGVVTAVGQGECFITASCRDNQAMCHIIVVDHFVFITLDEHEVRLLPNHMFTLTPTVSPANTSLVVTSSDPTVAAARMANGNIQVVGIAEGTTVVTVNSTDGYAEVDSCLVKVYTLRGDVNKDGFVNISDVTALINYLLSGDAEGIDIINADTNNDGKINIGDVTRLINHLLSGDELDPKEEPIEGEETFTVNGVSFTMVAVEGGTFTMGATPEQGDDAFDAEKPAHQVTLSSYCIGQTEVTQALWVAVMGTNPSRFKDRPENPVEGVTWIDCQSFIAQLNELTGKQFRLPTEAEWEYAARGGNQSQGYKYAGSNDIDEVAWYDQNSTSTQPVGTKKANELDLYDMSGNVWEWCQDYYGDYSAEPQTDPTGPETGTDRIRRGVGWNGSQLNGRVSHRSSRAETYKYNSLGLRLAL